MGQFGAVHRSKQWTWQGKDELACRDDFLGKKTIAFDWRLFLYSFQNFGCHVGFLFEGNGRGLVERSRRRRCTRLMEMWGWTRRAVTRNNFKVRCDLAQMG